MSISAIVAQESRRTTIEVITRNTDLGLGRSFTEQEIVAADAGPLNAKVTRLPPGKELSATWRRLRCKEPDIDVVYLNSLFSRPYSWWPLLLMYTRLVRRRRVLLAPRGELSTGALSIKSRRKKLASPVLRHVLHRLDVTWHASSPEEADTVREFLRDDIHPVFIRTDPAVPPSNASAPDGHGLTITFLGRMVPKKNFLLLARAAELLSVPATVVVAGILEDRSYWRRCADVIERLPDHVSVEVLGHVDRSGIGELLRRSDVMVLPTLGENFGHAIAEALSVGCPVMVPDTTPWTTLVSEGCGSVVDVDDPELLRCALEDLAAQSSAERADARRRIAARYADWWTSTQLDERSLFVAAFD